MAAAYPKVIDVHQSRFGVAFTGMIGHELCPQEIAWENLFSVGHRRRGASFAAQTALAQDRSALFPGKNLMNIGVAVWQE